MPDHVLDCIIIQVLEDDFPRLSLLGVANQHGFEHGGRGSQDVTMDGENLAVADDFEVAELPTFA